MSLKVVFTNYGLTALASAPAGGGYVAPQYLAIETTHGLIQNAGTLAAGATSVTLDVRADVSGDTQIVLGVGTANQEVVTFSGVASVSGQWVYTISATTLSHAHGDVCVRQPTANDTMASVIAEMTVDPVALPGQRINAATGYATSGANGQYTIQFYITGQQGNGFIAIIYLTDNVNKGAGNIHAYGILCIDHSFATGGSTSDLEIDAVLTLING